MVTLLLAAQCLALAHRIEHAPGSVQRLRLAVAAVSTDAATATLADAAAGAQVAQGGPGPGVSGHQAGDAECRLVDQLGHADALCGAAVCAAAPPRAVRHTLGAGNAVVALPPPAAYQARAPPQA